jgi:hypothetical protein
MTAVTTHPGHTRFRPETVGGENTYDLTSPANTT